MQHFVIYNKSDHETWHPRRIQRGAYGYRMVNRIIMTQTGPADPRSPSQGFDFDLIVEIKAIHLLKDVRERMGSSAHDGDELFAPKSTAFAHRRLNCGLLAEMSISSDQVLRGTPTHDFARQDDRNSFQNLPGSTLAMITDAHHPLGSPVPESMSQPNVGIKSGHDFRGPERREGSVKC